MEPGANFAGAPTSNADATLALLGATAVVQGAAGAGRVMDL